MKRVVALAATLLALGVSSHAQAQQKKEIVWGAPNVLSSYYWDVLGAIELGYMADVGLSIIWIFHDGLREIVNSLIEIVGRSAIPEITSFEIKVLSFGVWNVPIGRPLKVRFIVADKYHDNSN